MTTRLSGPATRFLPFNLGDQGGAGNPPNPTGTATAYLWEQVWARDSWLEILGPLPGGPKRDEQEADRLAVISRATTNWMPPASSWPTCWRTGAGPEAT
jgi:hypothetical protein